MTSTCHALGCVSDRQKLKRLLGERDEWRQELAELRRLLSSAERRVSELTSQAAEIAALKREIDFFSDLPTLKRENERQAAEIERLKGERDEAEAALWEHAAETARLEALVVSRVRASADAVVEIASQAAEIAGHKLHIEKLYSKLENRAREFSPGEKP